MGVELGFSHYGRGIDGEILGTVCWEEVKTGWKKLHSLDD
jgi:hypothetical protein